MSYPFDDLPVVTDVAGHPIEPDTINVSWTISGSFDCYAFDEVSVNCGSIMASEGEGTPCT